MGQNVVKYIGVHKAFFADYNAQDEKILKKK